MTNVIYLNFERLSKLNYVKKQEVGNFMRLNVLCGLMVIFTVNSAFSAGFIDERSSSIKAVSVNQTVQVGQTPSSVQPVPVILPGFLVGDFSMPGWSEIAPPSGDGVALSLALVRLTPLNLPAIEIDMPSNMVDSPVRWFTGATRKQALDEIAKRFRLSITFEGRSVTIRRAIFTPPTTSPSNPSIPAIPVQAPIPLLIPYEIRLSDIKISTSMNRWAAENNVRIRWDADKHVLVGAPMTFRASNILDAISQALSTPGIRNSDYPLEVCEYPNTPPLLRITRQGEQTKDCPILVNLLK